MKLCNLTGNSNQYVWLNLYCGWKINSKQCKISGLYKAFAPDLFLSVCSIYLWGSGDAGGDSKRENQLPKDESGSPKGRC